MHFLDKQLSLLNFTILADGICWVFLEEVKQVDELAVREKHFLPSEGKIRGHIGILRNKKKERRVK